MAGGGHPTPGRGFTPTVMCIHTHGYPPPGIDIRHLAWKSTPSVDIQPKLWIYTPVVDIHPLVLISPHPPWG